MRAASRGRPAGGAQPGAPSPQHVAEGLMGDDHSGQQRSARRCFVELVDKPVDEPRYLGEQPPIVAEERSKSLWHREHELAMRDIQENLIREVLGEQQRPLLAARWAQVETLAAERPEIVVSTRGIGTPDASHSEPVVPAGLEAFADVADAFKTEHAVLGGVPFVVDVAELVEMALEDRMELIAAPGNVPMT